MKGYGFAMAAIVAALALQGCAGGTAVKYAPGAGASAAPAQAAATDKNLVCTTERPMGSHLPVRTCRTREQVAQQAQAAQQSLQKQQQTQGNASGGR